jgi:uncharacterized membrane protein (DUF106 family)
LNHQHFQKTKYKKIKKIKKQKKPKQSKHTKNKNTKKTKKQKKLKKLKTKKKTNTTRQLSSMTPSLKAVDVQEYVFLILAFLHILWRAKFQNCCVLHAKLFYPYKV